ncbi:hypothetical protein D3C79_907700 [compost metagenome]
MDAAFAMKADKAFELVGSTADVLGCDGHVETSQMIGSDTRQAGNGRLYRATRQASLAQSQAVLPRFFATGPTAPLD